jgi:hypothetical protein
MAGRKTRSSGKAATLGELLASARTNAYMQRLLEDRDLRRRLQGAYGSARSAYGRLNNGRAPTRALLEDRRLQLELLRTARALKDVAQTLKEPAAPRKRAGSHRARRALGVAVVAGGAALVASKGLRGKVLDLLFGAEEEFNYSSTTTPPEPAPAAETAGERAA